jgi:hypothetical protein
MWTKTRSLILSRILVTAFTALIVMLGAFVPFFADWFSDISDGVGLFGAASVALPVSIGLYICEVFALAAMGALHILLRNIAADEIFIEQNTKCLRAISWDCMLAGCVFAVLGFWRILFWLPAFFIIMFGLIMRVLKNVFEQAVEIKAENDFTV